MEAFFLQHLMLTMDALRIFSSDSSQTLNAPKHVTRHTSATWWIVAHNASLRRVSEVKTEHANIILKRNHHLL